MSAGPVNSRTPFSAFSLKAGGFLHAQSAERRRLRLGIAREGEVIRLRHKWDGGCMWTLPGTKVGDYIAKRYVVS